MKLYLANGTYVGTQADAKAITKNFDLVEVPTDKEGLIAYLNRITFDSLDRDIDLPLNPDRVVKDVNEDVRPELAPRAPSYTEKSLGLDDAFAAAPLAHRLTLASLALEDARDLCPTLVAQPKPLKPTVAEDELDPFA